MPTPEIMKQMLTSPYLADKPLLFTKGQTVFHKEFGICKVDLALGARKRKISFRVYLNDDVHGLCPEERSTWVDVTDLSEMELTIQKDMEAVKDEDLSPQELEARSYPRDDE